MQWTEDIFDEDFPPNFDFGVNLNSVPVDNENSQVLVPDIDNDVDFEAEIADFILEGKAKETISKDKSDYLRKVLKAKRKELTRKGLGNKPNATRPLEKEEIEKLKNIGHFGWSTSESLQNLMWWCITTHFGYRARDEARRLRFGDICPSTDMDGNKYLEWDTERGSKTRNGEHSTSHQRSFNPKAFATDEWDCPVKTYELFVKHRPMEAMQEDSPFFLSNIPSSYIKNDIWYYPRPLGKNKLGEILSKASKLLGNDDKKSRNKVANHSARKTSISKLLDNNISPLHVSQLSDHKNIDSLLAYHSASRQKQQQMSDILANNMKGNSHPVSVHCPDHANTVFSSSNLPSTSSHLPTIPQRRCSDFAENIPLCIQRQMTEEWDPVSNQQQDVKIFHPILQGATFGANCHVKIHVYNSSPPQVQIKKRKRVIIEDDSQ